MRAGKDLVFSAECCCFGTSWYMVVLIKIGQLYSSIFMTGQADALEHALDEARFVKKW